MTYKDALNNLLRGKTVINKEVAPGTKFKFDFVTHGIIVNTSNPGTTKIIGPTAFADLDRVNNNWQISE